MPGASENQLCPFRDGIADQLLHFGYGLFIDHRPNIGAGGKAISDPERPNAVLQFLSECFSHSFLNKNPVRADAGLAAIAELCGKAVADRFLEIGILEDNERRVATKFKRDFFHCAGALLHQQFANGSGAGKRKFGNPGVLRENLSDSLTVTARDHIENASRKAGTLRQFTESES